MRRPALATPGPARTPVTGVRLSLWQAGAVFRLAGLALCLYLVLRWQGIYARPGVALAAAAAMIAVSAVVVPLAWTGRAHRSRVVAADVVLTAAITLLTIPAQTHDQQHGGMATLTTVWAAGPTLGAALLFGPAGGLAAAAVQFAVVLVVRDGYDGRTLYSGVLLVVVGTVVGLVVTYAARAEEELRTASAAQAALEERERLARSIHDGVLQVLGLVARTGRDEGGRWAELAAAAAEQEHALRGLVSSPVPSPTGDGDVAAALRRLASPTVTVAAPAEPVRLAPAAADELVAAVRAALSNVDVHAGPGARAWVSLDADEAEVRVTVRDDGAGFADGRLAVAEREGRLGVARSIRGRVEGLGGRCRVSSVPGEGTEVELAVPAP